jgi:Tfp pilus assembly protein PilN
MRPVNLLPESQRKRRPEGGGNSAKPFLIVLTVLLVMTGVYVITANSVTSRANQTAEASAEADQLEARAGQLGSFGDFAQTKQARVDAVRQLADSRFDWERMVRELSRVLPEGGWLTGVKASTTGESTSTAGGSTDASGSPTATLTGCMPRQTEVAQLMLRLRRMYRAEDVSLTSSIISDLQGIPSLENCGKLYQFEVTVTFAPATPVEAPDGERRVPAALGGGS